MDISPFLVCFPLQQKGGAKKERHRAQRSEFCRYMSAFITLANSYEQEQTTAAINGSGR